MATNLFARTYPSYSARSLADKRPSVDFSANSSIRIRSCGSGRNRNISLALSRRTIFNTGLTHRPKAAFSAPLITGSLYHRLTGSQKKNVGTHRLQRPVTAHHAMSDELSITPKVAQLIVILWLF